MRNQRAPAEITSSTAPSCSFELDNSTLTPGGGIRFDKALPSLPTMDSIDYYGLNAVEAKPAPSEAPNEPQPTLEEEVNQVVGQLGSFWGSFKRQVARLRNSCMSELNGVVECLRLRHRQERGLPSCRANPQ